MGKRLRPLMVGTLAIVLAGCSGYSPKSSFTLPTFPGLGEDAGNRADGKATVMLSAAVAGLTCAESLIVLATADGDGFKTIRVQKVGSDFGGGAGAAVVDLDPGTYHVVAFACRNGSSVVHTGGTMVKDQIPWKAERWPASLASFAVVGGEVLDAGALEISPARVDGFGAGIHGRKASLAVHPSDAEALAEIVRQQPELAKQLHSNPMQPSDAGQLVLQKCHLSAPAKALPQDGSSKITDVVTKHPEAGVVVSSIGTATSEADRCVADGGGLGAAALQGLAH